MKRKFIRIMSLIILLLVIFEMTCFADEVYIEEPHYYKGVGKGQVMSNASKNENTPFIVVIGALVLSVALISYLILKYLNNNNTEENNEIKDENQTEIKSELEDKMQDEIKDEENKNE